MNNSTASAQLETLKREVNKLQEAYNLAAHARDNGLRNIDLTYDFWSKGQPGLAAAQKKEFEERFKSVDQGLAKVHASLSRLVFDELQLAKLREENARLTARMAELEGFRTHLQEFLRGV